MRVKKIAGKLVRSLPIHSYYSDNQGKHIQQLKDTIKQLEDRNSSWEAEVRQLRGDDSDLEVLWPVFKEDLIEADYQNKSKNPIIYKRHDPPYTINWVVPVVGSVSGGHAVIFYLIKYLESRGHTCRIYFYDPLGQSSLPEIRKNMKNHVSVKAQLAYNEKDIADCDAIFATNWPTAYPVFNYKGHAMKFYLLQDYEPMFEPSGTYSALAENTYKLGLHGISSTPFTTQRVKKEYGMISDEIELGIDPSEYYLTNTNLRKKIVFYARPVTPRRGFELGVLALEEFHKKYPEYEINCIGWDISRYNVGFPYVGHGILSTNELNELYNQCAASLVLSFTSMSLTVVEMMAAGCVPVMNNGPDSSLVSYRKYIRAVEPNPTALAEGLYETIKLQEKNIDHAKKVADHAKTFNWQKYNDIFENIIIKKLSK